MKLRPLYLLLTSLHLLQSHVTFAILVRVIDEDQHLTIKRDTSTQEGSGSFADVTDGSARNLMSALMNLSSHTTIRLEPGNYTLEESILVRDFTNITLEGNNDERGVSILCNNRGINGTGLAFINVSNLTIRNITIDGCGFTGGDIKNTIDILNDTVNIFYVIPPVIRVGMLLGNCENLIMENTIVKNTRGFGLVGINVIGVSQLRNVLFFNNTNPGACLKVLAANLNGFFAYDSANLVGGAAFFVYFDYQDEMLYQGSQFMLSLKECTFIMNAQCSYAYFFNSVRFPNRGESRFLRNGGYRLGGSGALTLTLAQLQYGIDVNVTSSSFHNNSATFGGGFVTALFAGVHSTHITLDDCLLNSSSTYILNDVRPPTNFYYRPYLSGRDTTVSILNSIFINNQILTANSGGLLIYSNHYAAVGNINEVVSIYIEGCLFTRNRAFAGSAIHIYEHKINGFAVGIQVSIKDSDFIDNEILPADQDATVTVSQSAGTVDIRNVNLTLQGNCSFIDNIGTGLRAESSLVGIDGNITFLRNTGLFGGALYLVTYSYLIMNRNSSIYFIDNEARIGGGAIYVNENGLSSFAMGFQDCFIRFAYDNFVLCEDCSDLDSYGVFIKFSGNNAPSGGSMVSGSSLVTCPWVRDLIFSKQISGSFVSVYQILDQNYPDVFSFDQPPDNPSLVRSFPGKLKVDLLTDSNSSNAITEVFPGQVFYANISALDDFNNIIANVIAAYASPDTPTVNNSSVIPFLSSNAFAVLSDNIPTRVPIRVHGMENQSINLVIYSTDLAGRAQEQINIELYSCGFGFIFDVEAQICTCNSRLESLGIFCNNSQEIIVPDGMWIGPFRGEIVVHECIFRYCRSGQQTIVIQSPDETKVNFDDQCDASMNRAGFLCGSCRAGYSAVLGSRRCKQCSNWYILLFPVFFAIGIIAIFFIKNLNITITAGFINGAIFYSNIVSLYGSTLVPGSTLINGSIAFVSFPTLSLGFETCLHDKMSTLEKVWWQLSFPFYLFVLMGITTLLARTKYLKFNRLSGLSTIQAFATLLVLCYVSVLQACIELIGVMTIYSIGGIPYVQWISDPSIEYFGPEHGTLGFLAYLLLVFYIIPLPFFLLFPSFLYRNRHFSKFKPIYDAFWDSFKLKYRFYLGFRLIFRWIPFVLAVFVRPPISISVTNFFLIILVAVHVAIQPFREKWRNIVDAIFLFNLLLLFSGSTFFWSEYNSAAQNNRSLVTSLSLAYSSILILFGFLVMLLIFFYHILVRFPKLRKLLGCCWNKTPLQKIYNIPPPKDNEIATTFPLNNTEKAEGTPSRTYSTNTTDNRSTGKIQPPVISASELREPLLESGTVDVYSIDPSPVSTY